MRTSLERMLEGKFLQLLHIQGVVGHVLLHLEDGILHMVGGELQCFGRTCEGLVEVIASDATLEVVHMCDEDALELLFNPQVEQDTW